MKAKHVFLFHELSAEKMVRKTAKFNEHEKGEFVQWRLIVYIYE